MTLYAAALRLLGLSHAEAARLHNVRLDTVKSWSAGRRSAPPGCWDELRALYARQRAAVERKGEPASKDWPSAAALAAVLAARALEA